MLQVALPRGAALGFTKNLYPFEGSAITTCYIQFHQLRIKHPQKSSFVAFAHSRNIHSQPPPHNLNGSTDRSQHIIISFAHISVLLCIWFK
jgi:hypothetical protein